MNYCIVSTFFVGATLPLVKHLTEHNHYVDFFLFTRQGQTGQETLIYDKAVRGGIIQKISKSNRIYNYLDISSNIYLIPYYSINKKKYIEACLSLLKNQWIVYKTIIKIKRKKYDVIYIIVHEKLDYLLCKWLKKLGFKNIIIAYHEVLQRHIGNQELKVVVKKTLKFGYPIVTYSKHTKAVLQKATLNSDIHTIYYGPFETYKLFNTDQRLIQEEYILFIGHINYYKGLPFLYETIEEYGIHSQYKVVVAGKGNDKVIEKIKKDKRFILMNHFLEDSEFANLVRYAKCVVCPYVAGSQSGITHVSLIYGTPVIATKVAAFQEFIEDERTGFLVDYGDKKQLASAINKIILNNQQKTFYIPLKLRWSSIVDEFESYTRRIHQRIYGNSPQYLVHKKSK